MGRRLVVFSGYNQRAVIALLRTAKKLKIATYIIASGYEDSIFDTAYKQDVYCVRKELKLDIGCFKPIFQKLASDFPDSSFLIAPSTESLNELFLLHRSVLEECRCILPLVEKKLYSRITDKLLFQELCQGHGLYVPGVYENIEICPECFVAKPKYNYSEISKRYLSPIIIRSKTEREQFLQQYQIQDFYFQEYIWGQSYYLLYYFDKEQNVFRFSQRNLLQQADGKSMILAETAQIHNSQISIQYEQMFKEILFRGLVMIELRKNNKGYCMIEANPRMWGPLQLCVDAKANLLQAFLYDWGLTMEQPRAAEINDMAKYCWLGGIKENLKKQKCIVPLTEETIDLPKLTAFLENDIYCREDTMQLFEKE